MVPLYEWLTLSHVSKKGKKRKEKLKKIKKICGDDKWIRRKVGASFPHFFINTGRRSKKGREERKRKIGENERKDKMKNEKEKMIGANKSSVDKRTKE